ncbi:hypothetical protein [Bradyrhizobium sp. CCBAU 25338]|uniref:hypothetical protein n=1 Tax=Bradyrhizobium sp. CCBAU 25338 TaxID=1641877 RepID=UPI002304B23C|nr:hypothetical protein [Bradyrhizobium sp. CCBAU 25338]
MTSTKNYPRHKSVHRLDLLDWLRGQDNPTDRWRHETLSPATAAGSFVARRYRVRPGIADLIADLAGLGSEVRS